MIPVLILLRPLDLKTGQRVDIRAGSSPDATALGLNGTPWEPFVSRRPRIAQDLMSLDLDGKFKLAAADFVLSMNLMTQYAHPERLYWPGAAVTIWSVSDLAWDRRVVEFDGLVVTAPTDLITKKMTVNAAVDRTRIDKPLLTGEFNADGQAGGGPEMRGKLYPAGFGYNENVEWVLFDAIYNIGMLDGYGNLQGVSKAMEGLASLGPSSGDFPTYGQLKQAIINKTIAPGSWGTCLAQGMVGLGAPPVGRITFHATFGSNRTGAILKRVLTLHAGLPATGMIGTSFDAIDVVANYEVRAHFTDQIQISDMIEQMCQPLNATPLVTVQNKVAITLSTAAAPVATLNRSASAPPLVTAWRTADPVVPIYKVIYRAERPADVLGYSEVNYDDDLVDRGLYDPTETYRQGHLVWLADKSQWLYINATPNKGHTPGDPADNGAYWIQMQPATDATTIYYPSGKTVAELEPAEAGADVTGDNTSKDTFAVGGRAATEIISSMDINTAGLLEAILNGDELNELLDAMTLVSGQPVSVAFLNFKGQQLGTNSALGYQINAISAKNDDSNAFILEVQRVMVNKTDALSQRLDQVTASTGGVNATVQLLMEALVSNDVAYSKAILRADADGVFGAFSLTADGATRLSRISMVADELEFVDRNGGGAPIKALYYADGVWQLAENLYVKNLFADTITTKHIKFNQVTGKTYWQANYGNGASAANVAGNGQGVWRTFGLAGNPATVTTEGDVVQVGTEICIRAYVNQQRTGDDNDRLSYRIRRDGPGGAVVIGDIVYSGMGGYPQMVSYEWQDAITVEGKYTYTLEIMRGAGGGTFYLAKLICDVGRR